MEALVAFYKAVGLSFREEKHGNGPVHFSTLLGDTVLEVYPLPKSVQTSDATTRLGFTIDRVEDIVQKLRAMGVQILTEPLQTQWGYRATVKDPDGRAVELNQSAG